jgi:hypothetical protein
MTSIEIPDEQAAVLTAKAASEGLTLKTWLEKLALEIEQTNQPNNSGSLRGILKKYGPAPSKEEIDQNRREMFANFPRDY